LSVYYALHLFLFSKLGLKAKLGIKAKHVKQANNALSHWLRKPFCPSRGGYTNPIEDEGD